MATVTLHTNHGDIALKLYDDKAPKACENFAGLAKGGQYDGVIFHRVIDGFMIQGGDPTGTGRGGPGYTFADEFHPELAFTKPYLLAMANAGPGTNGSQFFITLAPTTWLNDKHTIFGEVEAGMEVVDAIGKCAKGPGDRPLKDVVIERCSVAG